MKQNKKLRVYIGEVLKIENKFSENMVLTDKLEIRAKDYKNLCKEGYRKLAFGSISDIVKLMVFDDEEISTLIDSLDLFNISKIQKQGNKVVVDIFNRKEALDRLFELEKEDESEKLSLDFLNMGK